MLINVHKVKLAVRRHRLTRALAIAVALLASAGIQAAEPFASYVWKNVTVGAGGFAPNIVFSLAEENLVYLRTDMGGAYRWHQPEQRWLPLQDGMPESNYFGIESIAPDPHNPDVVYAAAGMYRHEQAAMLRSRDRGNTWKIIPVAFRMGGNEDGRGLGERLAVDPNNTSILYFGTRHDGLYRSTDKGATWRKVESFPHAGRGLPGRNEPTHAGISFVVFDPAGGDDKGSRSIYVGVADPGKQHLYRSRDGGITWQAVEGEPAPRLFPVKASLDRRGLLYIAYSNAIGPNGVTDGAVFKLNTRTDSWTDISPEKGAKRHPGGYMAISLDRQKPDTVMVATMNRWHPGDTIWRSTDGGKNWTDIRAISRRDVSAAPFLRWGNKEADFGWWIAGLAINPFDSDHVAYTTGATLYATPEASAKTDMEWSPWIRGIEQTAVITLASLPEGPPLLSGFGDLSGFVHERLDVSPHIQFTDPVFANTNSIDYAGLSPNTVVRSGTPAHRSEGLGPTLAYSADYGKTWRTLAEPDHEGQTGSIAVVVSADGARFLLSTPQPRWSNDRGRSWKKVEGLPRHARPVADKLNPDIFYAMDFENSRVFISLDGGKSFSGLETTGLPEDIRADRPTWREAPWPLLASPVTSGELWFVSRAGLFRSQDQGLSFVKVVSELDVQILSFGKARTGSDTATLYAIGTKGNIRAVWRSDDGGRRWHRLNDDRHRYGQRFRTLAGDLQHYGRVYVATDGRGIVYGEPARAEP